MKKTILVYGLISAAVILGNMLIGLASGVNEENMAGLEYLGYLIMIVAFSLIFFGIKRYRDRDLGGVIRFGTALMTGLGITLIASLIYVVGWEVNLAATDHAFINDYTDSIMEARRAEGAGAAEMAEVSAEMEQMRAQYAKTPYRLFITFLEIFPVGLIISLICAAILRKSSVLPDQGGGSAAV